MENIDSNEITLFNLDIEKRILSSILIEPYLLSDISEKISSSDFYDNRNKSIYEAMLGKFQNDFNIELDLGILIDEMNKKNTFNRIGGEEYLKQILEFSVTSANINSYIEILKEYSKKRQLNDVTKIILDGLSSRSSYISTNELIDKIQTKLSEVSQEGKEDARSIKELLLAKMKSISDTSNRKDNILTGFRAYDDLTKGLKPTNLIILAARPAVGKTAFCLNIALNAALNKKKVLIFSLEMGSDELIDRLISIRGQINSEEFEKAKENPELSSSKNVLERYYKSMRDLKELDIYVDPNSSPNINDIKNSCRRTLLRLKSLDLIIIDYLQLISGGNSNNREQVIAEISRGLKLLAKELEIPIIALSQLSRSVEKREKKRPMLSDLRESGSIEQDADQVLFLHNEKYYHNNDNTNTNEELKGKDLVELIVAKNRSGGLRDILLVFEKNMQKFLNPSPETVKVYWDDKNNK